MTQTFLPVLTIGLQFNEEHFLPIQVEVVWTSEVVFVWCRSCLKSFSSDVVGLDWFLMWLNVGKSVPTAWGWDWGWTSHMSPWRWGYMWKQSNQIDWLWGLIKNPCSLKWGSIVFTILCGFQVRTKSSRDEGRSSRAVVIRSGSPKASEYT